MNTSVNQFGFKPSIAEAAADEYAAAKKFPGRIRPFGVMLLLNNERIGMRHLRTVEIAKRLGTTESTMYRHVGKPAVQSFLDAGRDSLVKDHRNPRFNALKAYALDLALDGSLSLENRISKWSTAYSTTANPGHIYL